MALMNKSLKLIFDPKFTSDIEQEKKLILYYMLGEVSSKFVFKVLFHCREIR